MTPEEKPMNERGKKLVREACCSFCQDRTVCNPDGCKFLNRIRNNILSLISTAITSRNREIVEGIKRDMANDFEHRTGFHVGTKHWRLGMNRAIDIIEGRVSRKS